MTSALPAVDVIIPIYNGYDVVGNCIESVLANTHGPASEIGVILADDASPDPRIGPLLEEFAARDDRVQVHSRTVNLGFPENCNESMRASRRDIVILNSDTEVPPGWLTRLRTKAASSARVGSVTPLTNNGTVCSVPEWLKNNPFGSLDTNALDEIAQATATGLWIELPTGVGFCQYFTRTALDTCGYFDGAVFGKGYGEENDLCLRIRHEGLVNLLADDVFVSHIGGVSFSEAGTSRLDENLAKIGRLWPDYHALIQEFIADNPLAGVQARFGLEMLRRTPRSPGKPRVLYMLHNAIWGTVIGGTEFHVQDLVEALRGEIEPIILSPRHGTRPILQWDDRGHVRSFPIAYSFDSEWVRQLLSSGIDLVHIHHWIDFPADALSEVLAVCAAVGIPTVVSLHDYYAACPGIQLLDARTKQPCVSLEGTDRCDGCEIKAGRTARIDVEGWRREHRAALAQASLIVSPSEAARHVLLQGLRDAGPQLDVHVEPHALPTSWPSPTPKEPAEPYRISVIGYGGAHKGDRVLIDLIAHLDGLELEWHFYGRKKLRDLPDEPPYFFHGTYERDALHDWLVEDDFALLVSTWPETFSYTLSEAWSAGLPVFATAHGALQERVSEAGAGMLLSDDPAAAATEIRAALADPDRILAMQRATKYAAQALRTLPEMATAYLGHYRALLAAASPAAIVPSAHEPGLDEVENLMGSFRSPLPAVDVSREELATPVVHQAGGRPPR